MKILCLFAISITLTAGIMSAAAVNNSTQTRTLHRTSKPANRVTHDDDVLRTLRVSHPRLFVNDEDVARLKTLITDDPQTRRWYEDLQAKAAKAMAEPRTKYVIIGPRLLEQSRAALRRVTLLAGLYLLDRDERFAARAVQEMRAAAAFPDWNPSHFLDTAEMTTALAIGYDWLYDYLTPQDRALIRRVIIEKGLQPGLKAYERGDGWTTGTNNWNQVCSSGMTIGALAVADEEPALARRIIDYARVSIRLPMNQFAPDGGYEEGPGYWNYGTRYNIFYLAAVQSALGTMFGLERTQGFADTGMFRIHVTSPTSLTFNFADGNETAGTSAHMLWMAREMNRPVYAEHERAMVEDNANIFHLLWAGASGERAKRIVDLPLDVMFRRINVAFFRGGWNDSRAAYVGFKGGSNQASHAHLDLGTFVFDALGQRWVSDLGPDDYNLPGYWDSKKMTGKRWSYYRLNTHGHNTLVINEANQEATASAPIVAFHSAPERAFAVADLTTAYTPVVTRAHRGVALLERRRLLVQDEVTARSPVEIKWQMHTRAVVEINRVDARRAVLTQGGEELEARILSPMDARFDVEAAAAPPPQAQQPDVRKLIVRLVGKVSASRIVVLLTPRGLHNSGNSSSEKIEPLAKWIAAGSLTNHERRKPK